MIRDKKSWNSYALKNITGGYVAGANKNRFAEGSLALLNRLEKDAGRIAQNDVILDIGCGNGRLAVALDLERVSFKRYIGFDVVKESIDFCKHAFVSDPRFEFHHADVVNGHYADKNKGQAIHYNFPWRGVTLVVANSLFTHLGKPHVAEEYLTEVRDCLEAGGRFYSTWFRSPPHEVDHGEAMSVYKESDIRQWLEARWFEIKKEIAGEKKTRDDQWRVVCVKV